MFPGLRPSVPRREQLANGLGTLTDKMKLEEYNHVLCPIILRLFSLTSGLFGKTYWSSCRALDQSSMLAL